MARITTSEFRATMSSTGPLEWAPPPQGWTTKTKLLAVEPAPGALAMVFGQLVILKGRLPGAWLTLAGKVHSDDFVKAIRPPFWADLLRPE